MYVYIYTLLLSTITHDISLSLPLPASPPWDPNNKTKLPACQKLFTPKPKVSLRPQNSPPSQIIFVYLKATRISLAGCNTISAWRPGSCPSILFSTVSKRWKMRTRVYAISVSANCWPMQILGPPLKGM